MLSQFKMNINFIQKIRSFRDLVYDWIFELCKEESKLDFDTMARLISTNEDLCKSVVGGKGEEGVISWAMDRVHSISPTIQGADQKLNGVISAI